MPHAHAKRSTSEVLGEVPHLTRHTARGAQNIFTRFLLVAVGLNTLVGLGVVVYDVADSITTTQEHLTHTATVITKVARELRAQSDATDVAIVKRAAQLTKAPMALLSKGGQMEFTTAPEMARAITRVFPDGPQRGIRIRIDDRLDWLSGAWSITDFSPQHDLVVIAIRHPEEEGLALHFTVAAGIVALGIVVVIIVMLLAANWILRRPLYRLVTQLTGALRDQLTFRNNLIDASESVGMVAADGNGRIQIFNRAAERILGCTAEEVVGHMTLAELRTQASGGAHTRMRTARHSLVHAAEGEEIWLDRHGIEHLLSISASLIPPPDPAEPEAARERPGVLVTFIDITERRRLEADLHQSELQLVQSAKLATLGEMATGVAHELNQPLNNIGLLAQRLALKLRRSDMPEDTRSLVREKLDKIRGQVDRAGKIIDHLRTFGRPAPKQMTAVDVHGPVGQVVELLGEQLQAHGIDLEVDLPGSIPGVLADEGQLEQVLMNLVVNARDALDELGDDEVERKRVRITAAEARLPGGAAAVALTVEDNGRGIPEEVRERLFEPFFTTKEVGKGTGLGLSISYGLVRDFGGTLTLESRGEGLTRFSVTLRRAPARAEAGLRPPATEDEP